MFGPCFRTLAVILVSPCFVSKEELEGETSHANSYIIECLHADVCGIFSNPRKTYFDLIPKVQRGFREFVPSPKSFESIDYTSSDRKVGGATR